MYAAQNVQNFTIAKIGELENQAQSLQKEGAQVQFKLDQLRAIIFCESFYHYYKSSVARRKKNI